MMPKICALAVLMAIVGYVISELGFKGKKTVGAVFLVILSLGVLELVSDAFGKVGEFAELSGAGETARTALKVLGTGYVFGVASDVSAELGESGISKVLEIAGRAEMTVIVLPYLGEVIKLSLEMIK